MAKASDNIFPKVIESMQTTDPAAPSDASWKIYAKAGGIYARSSNAVVGPFGTSGGAASLGDSQVNFYVPASFYTVDAGTWTITQWTDAPTAALAPYQGYGIASGAQNDALSWALFLAAGTWTAKFFIRKSSNTGIITLNQDTVSQGTVDTYAAAPAQAIVSITGWTVATTGLHTMQVKMATKNGSSSGYLLDIWQIQFIRTA